MRILLSNRSMQLRLLRFVPVLGCIMLMGCGNPEGTEGIIELKFGHVGAPGSLFALSAEEFSRRVEEKYEGRVKVNVFGSSQLGGDELMLQKLKLGTLDLALPSTIMSSRVELFGIFEMPYLVKSREHMRKIEEHVIWPVLVPAAAEEGYKIIAVWENGFRHVTNNTRPVVTPGDLVGIKLRTPRGIWRVKLFQAFGANPSPMPLSEVFVALQTGVMDGQENPLAQIYASKLHEVQSYMSLTGHVYTPAYVAVGASWNRIPEDLRTGIADIAAETQRFVYETAIGMDSEFLVALSEAGVEVNEPDREAFERASREIYDEFSRSVEGAGDLVKQSLDLVESSGL